MESLLDSVWASQQEPTFVEEIEMKPEPMYASPVEFQIVTYLVAAG
jgi:hypothetical protein